MDQQGDVDLFGSPRGVATRVSLGWYRTGRQGKVTVSLFIACEMRREPMALYIHLDESQTPGPVLGRLESIWQPSWYVGSETLRVRMHRLLRFLQADGYDCELHHAGRAPKGL